MRRAERLAEDEAIDLIIDGRPARFLRMKRGKDGRPTPGLKPAVSSASFWKAMQARRGDQISIELAPSLANDAYLKSLTPLLSEWETQADCAAYDDLPTA